MKRPTRTFDDSRRRPNALPQARTPRARKGFALVLSLGLMSLMVLLMVTLSAMVGIEAAAARQQRDEKLAKQNAYCGLMVAMGELQKTAGPDQRVTARADILENADRTVSSPYTLNQPGWTGVWNANGNVVSWLVSGNSYSASASNPTYTPTVGTGALTGTNAVRLVGEGTLATGGYSKEVNAPRIAIEKDGAFAYWVGDEGVKAKVNRAVTATNSTTSTASIVTNSALLAPGQLGIERMENMAWLKSVKANDAALFEKPFSDGSLKIISADPSTATAASQHFDDITAWSFGVLADSAKGGLKKDLTAGLFSAGSAASLSGSIFPAQSGSASDTDPGGPDWAQLRSWATTTASDTAKLPVRPATATQSGVFPIVSGFQFYFMPVYKAAENNSVYVYIMPAVVLWNPYDRPLEKQDYTVVYARSDITQTTSRQLTNPMRMPQLYIEGSDGTVPANDGASNVNKHVMALNNTYYAFTIPNVSLAPGEAKVYSPSGKNPYTYVSPGYPNAGMNELQEGFRPESVFYFISRDALKSGYPATSLSSATHSLSGAITVRNKYRWSVPDNGMIHSVFLVRGTGASGPEAAETLQDILFIYPGDGGGSENLMLEFGEALTTNAREEQALGFKIIQEFSDNDYSPPSARPGRPKWLAALNPRASTVGTAGRTRTNFQSRNTSFYGAFFTDASLQTIANSANQAYVGHQEGANNVQRSILFEASPGREGLWSLGQFMHAPLFRWEKPGTSHASTDARVKSRTQRGRFDNLIPAYAVGNSEANPFVPDLASAYKQVAAGSGDADYFGSAVMRYDYSYLLNEALWDGYFLSTLPDNADIDVHPSNPRLVRYPDATEAFQLDINTSAQHLLVDGAFNVNSTSVEAWKALLSSYMGQSVTRRDGSDKQDENGAPFVRHGVPTGDPVSPTGVSDGSQEVYDGYRLLNQEQIDKLAEQIVRQVRLRGPFPSLSKFVNRTLTASSQSLQLRGAIAEAIALADINKPLQSKAVVSQNLNAAWVNAAAEKGYTNEHVPGWLSQADILARLGAVLSARSDTFRIRSYGEYTPPDGAHPVKAWCEAIVQRVPEFVDTTNTPESATLNAVNQKFGRRFVILSLRWLTQEEI